METWFYHLESSTLHGVLPDLLTKTLEKGWRTLVVLPDDQLADMDAHLWTFRKDSFLPHGRGDEPQADLQPILLSGPVETAEGFDALILTHGAEVPKTDGVSRAMVLINGRVQEDVQRERKRWKTLSDVGADIAYFQQNARGRWEKKA